MLELTPQRQKFAELIATGTNKSAAYCQAFGKEKITDSVRNCAARLAKAPDILAKITELRQRAVAESEAAAVLTILEKRMILAQYVRTPVTKLHERANEHLIKRTTQKMLGAGEVAEVVTEIEGYDKIAAMKLDTELAGDKPKDPAADALAQLLTAALTAAPSTHQDKM